MAEPEYKVEPGPFDEQLMSSVSHLATEIFGAIDETDLHWRLKHLPVATLTLAFFDGDLIGFKFGPPTGPNLPPVSPLLDIMSLIGPKKGL